jgi:hypothetical protein
MLLTLRAAIVTRLTFSAPASILSLLFNIKEVNAMRRIFNIFLMFFLTLNFATGANAGGKKWRSGNNYQTIEQQRRYARMTKKDPYSKLFQVTPTALDFTDSTHLFIGLLLFSSLIEFGNTPKIALRANAKHWSYPFTVENGEKAIIPNDFQLPAFGQQQDQGVGFSKYFLAHVHPGLYNKPTKRLSNDELIEKCYNENLIRMDFDGQAKCFHSQEMIGALEFDQSFVESGPDDRLFSDKAYEWLQEEFFPKYNQDTSVLFYEKFFTNDPRAFQNNIKKLNAIFQEGSSGYFGKEFRDSRGALYILNNNKFPEMRKITTWKKYIIKRAPHLLDSYYAIEDIANDLARHLAEIPAFAQFASKAASQPFDVRMTAAVTYIALSKTFEKYLVLTENFSLVPSYTNKEFYELFTELRKDTLKLFESDPIKAAAYFHFKYVIIHPHEDANGRTARAIMNVILMSVGIDPVFFPSNNQYQDACLRSIKANSEVPFEDFLKNLIYVQQKEKKFFLEFNKKLDACEKDCQAILDGYFEENFSG